MSRVSRRVRQPKRFRERLGVLFVGKVEADECLRQTGHGSVLSARCRVTVNAASGARPSKHLAELAPHTDAGRPRNLDDMRQPGEPTANVDATAGEGHPFTDSIGGASAASLGAATITVGHSQRLGVGPFTMLRPNDTANP